MHRNTKYWFFTWETNIIQKQLPNVEKLKKFLNKISDVGTFQIEKGGLKGKIHYQGIFTLSGPRLSKIQVLNAFREDFDNTGGLTISKIFDKTLALNYVTKEETRVDGPYYCGKNQEVQQEMLETKLNKWQESLFDFLILKKNDKVFRDRKIIWVEDKVGNTGKSYFQKWLRLGQSDFIARKLPVSTVERLISAVSKVTKSVKVELFMINLTRTQGEEQSFKGLFAAIEDIKDGFVVDTLYGKYDESIFVPPLIVIFSNSSLNDYEKYLSKDRWLRLIIDANKEIEQLDVDSEGFTTPTKLTEIIEREKN